MFSNYTQVICPDNKYEFLDTSETDEIIIGGNVLHTFELPFKQTGFIRSGRVIYKQGEHVIQPTLNILPAQIWENDYISVVSVPLSSAYTKEFDKDYLDTYCQLELITVNNETYYCDPKKLKVLAPLEYKRSEGLTNDV